VFLVDTNILVHAVNRQSPEHEKAAELLAKWRSLPDIWYVTWPIVYEFLRVSTHPSIFERPLKVTKAWSFIESLLAASSCDCLVETDRHGEVLHELAEEYPSVMGSLLHDFHTVVLMREHGVNEIRTADTDFHQFKFLRVVNPLAS
jgi:hypothetical protein